MAFILMQDGIVVQKQPYPQEGFVEVTNDVVCGMVLQDGIFVNPPPSEPSAPEMQRQVAEIQAQFMMALLSIRQKLLCRMLAQASQ